MFYPHICTKPHKLLLLKDAAFVGNYKKGGYNQIILIKAKTNYLHSHSKKSDHFSS